MTAEIVLALRVLMAVALYAFLGRAVYIIWRDLRAQSEQASSRQIPTLTITCLDGDPPPAPRDFATPEIIIGRDPTCDLQLPNETVSSRHARLSFHHNQWWVEDLQSTNGTFINEERIYTPIVIISGDELRCGQENLQVSIHAATS